MITKDCVMRDCKQWYVLLFLQLRGCFRWGI